MGDLSTVHVHALLDKTEVPWKVAKPRRLIVELLVSTVIWLLHCSYRGKMKPPCTFYVYCLLAVYCATLTCGTPVLTKEVGRQLEELEDLNLYNETLHLDGKSFKPVLHIT